MSKCKLCGVEMTTDPTCDKTAATLDCGGDCLRCTAEAGDIHAQQQLALAEFNNIYYGIQKIANDAFNRIGNEAGYNLLRRLNEEFVFYGPIRGGSHG